MNEPSEQLDEAIENWRMGQFDQQIRFGSRLPSLPPADRVPGQPPRRPPVPADQAGKDGEVRELLETAQRVEALPALRPGAEFSRRLEQRLQTRADALRANGRRQRSRSLLATPA